MRAGTAGGRHPQCAGASQPRSRHPASARRDLPSAPSSRRESNVIPIGMLATRHPCPCIPASRKRTNRPSAPHHPSSSPPPSRSALDDVKCPSSRPESIPPASQNHRTTAVVPAQHPGFPKCGSLTPLPASIPHSSQRSSSRLCDTRHPLAIALHSIPAGFVTPQHPECGSLTSSPSIPTRDRLLPHHPATQSNEIRCPLSRGNDRNARNPSSHDAERQRFPASRIAPPGIPKR